MFKTKCSFACIDKSKDEKLDNIKAQIGKQYQKISDHDNFVSAEKVKNAYLGFGDEYRTLLSIADEFYESYSKRVGKDHTEGSYEQLLINRKRVEMFLRDRYYFILPHNILARTYQIILVLLSLIYRPNQ